MVGLVASTVGDRAKIAKGICVFQHIPTFLFPTYISVLCLNCSHPIPLYPPGEDEGSESSERATSDGIPAARSSGII